jgi:biopolymer transport protein TolR
MAFSTGSSSGSSAEINVTPLIDVLLVLLIIFMVIGPALSHGLDSTIPPAGNAVAGSAQQPVTVTVMAGLQGGVARYRIGQQEARFEEIRPRLRQLFAARTDEGRTLFVEADRSLSFQQVAQVAGEGRAAGAGAIALTRVSEVQTVEGRE